MTMGDPVIRGNILGKYGKIDSRRYVMLTKSGAAMKAKTKNNGFEFYRVLFTIVIVLHHSQWLVGDFTFLKHGYLCVEFFFILSGYLLYSTYRRETTHSTLGYVLSRYKRLWPEYAIAAILEILARGVFLQDFQLSKAVNELLMVQNTGLFRLGGYNYPCWYVPVMVFGGVFVYSLLTLNPGLYRKLIAPAIIMCGYTYIWGLGTKIECFGYSGFISYPMVRGVCALSVGVLVGILKEREILDSFFGRIGQTILEVISLVFIALGLMTDISSDMLTIVSFSLLIWCVAEQKSILSGKILNGRIWGTAGEYMYAIFLNHAIVIYVLSFISGHILPIKAMYMLPLVIGITALYAVISHNLIIIITNKLRKE